ncbi:MAG TPA: ATP-binding protein [Anaerovoracaceae bacterium]|nr:ATP-binding protein [Anaerovoracaceae bacterium]
MKVRIIFIIFLIISISVLIYYNYFQGGFDSDYSKRVEIVIFIFVVTFFCVSYIVYESYRIMYSEMTERMNMITESKNDLQITYNSLSMFMIEIGSDYTILNVNEAVCRYLGRKRYHIIGKSLDSVIGFQFEAREFLKRSINETFTKNVNGKSEVESDGKIFEFFTFPMQDASEKLTRVLLMMNDVTQVRAMYRQMLQENKMTAIGQLAAGVAHEIRNPLGLIRNYCHLLKKSSPDDEELKSKAINMMEKAVDRSNEIIDNLLRFSRMSNEKWRDVNLKQSILSILSFEEHTLIKNNINVTLNCDEEINLYLVQESVEMIMINLIINAVDAMESGGEIIIECSENEEEVAITISDTGVGIPEEIRANIFNPFFTTKENRNGCGLGLYIVYNEISKLNGKITVISEVGVGTTFTILLPVKRGEVSYV